MNTQDLIREDFSHAPVEAIADNLKPLLEALAPQGIPPPQMAGILAGAAFVMLTLRDHRPDITRTMEDPGPAPG